MLYQLGVSSLLRNPPILLTFSSIEFEIPLRNGFVCSFVRIAPSRLSSPAHNFPLTCPRGTGVLILSVGLLATATFARLSMSLQLPRSRNRRPSPPSSCLPNMPRIALKALPPFRVDTPAGRTRTAVILPTTPLIACLA